MKPVDRIERVFEWMLACLVVLVCLAASCGGGGDVTVDGGPGPQIRRGTFLEDAISMATDGGSTGTGGSTVAVGGAGGGVGGGGGRGGDGSGGGPGGVAGTDAKVPDAETKPDGSFATDVQVAGPDVSTLVASAAWTGILAWNDPYKVSVARLADYDKALKSACPAGQTACSARIGSVSFSGRCFNLNSVPFCCPGCWGGSGGISGFGRCNVTFNGDPESGTTLTVTSSATNRYCGYGGNLCMVCTAPKNCGYVGSTPACY